MVQKAEKMLLKIINEWLCNVQLFPKVWILEILIKAFRIPDPYAIPVWNQFLDILIRLETHCPAGYPTGKPSSDHLCQVQLHKTNVQYVRFVEKNEGCCCNLSVGDALKMWLSHAQYMKMTRDEHVLGFKPYDFSIYWLIWKLSFLFKQSWFGIDDFLLNFFETFVSVFGLQIIVTFGSVLGLQVTVGL